MSKLKQKLINSIEASKIEIKNEDIQETNRLIKKQLSIATFENLQFARVTVYHIESFYRDNMNDKFELRG
uniref:Uncharacterized protein n=1 Tax=viral metagenome TaxID=1070528 RepID=A0A6C0KRT0_9ZZZZ